VAAEAKKPLLEITERAEERLRVMTPAAVDIFATASTEEERKAKAAATKPVNRDDDRNRTRLRKRPKPPKEILQSIRPRPTIAPPAERKVIVRVPISLKDFSAQAGIKVNDILKKLLEKGGMATINMVLDEDAVLSLALEFNREIDIQHAKRFEDTVVLKSTDRSEDLIARAPVVTFMGHVDHGKTSLLDKIRNSNKAEQEAGGITQHIGAYRVRTASGKEVVFLDTPGHEAFTAMRARGATVTDLVVLVVAADDGVMPQTEEAVSHAKAAKVPIVVAINKVDRPDANANKVRQQLAQFELIPEEWGGQTVMVEVSALTGQGVNELVELLSLQAELLELKANPKRPAIGTVLEARKDESRGPVVTLLVQAGTLKKGDVLICGPTWGR
jgi:translation initiation factor IF-2